MELKTTTRPVTQLEAGKYYQTRAGDIVKVTAFKKGTNSPWKSSNETYTDAGKVWSNADRTCDADLVFEVDVLLNDGEALALVDSLEPTTEPKPEPTLVSLDKQYKTRHGYEVILHNIIPPEYEIEYPVRGIKRHHNGKWTTGAWTTDGLYVKGSTDPLDLVEVKPYDDFKVDDPVMVRDDGDTAWRCRYFAGVDGYGKPMTWVHGSTSWSVMGQGTTDWDQCRRPTSEELKSN